MEPRERRALRLLARVTAWVVAVPVGLVGVGYVVQTGQTYRHVRLQDDRAHRILDRWDAALAAGTANASDTARRFVPAGELTGQDGDWEPEVGENDKIALIAGQVVVAPGAKQVDAPATGTVRWADGVSADVPLMGATEALDALRRAVRPAAADCRGCRPLEVTGAVLGLSEVTTDHGRATVPTWRYTVAGTAVVVTRVAVAPTAAASVPALEDYRSPSVQGVIRPDGWTVSADGRTLSVVFGGADGPGSEPCGADYAGRTVESGSAVVVVLRQTSPSYWRQVGRILSLRAEYACPAIAVSRTVEIRLDAPLGDRTVLDIGAGTPLPTGVPRAPA